MNRHLQSEDWSALSALMDEALDLAPTERARWLAALPLADAAQREWLARWLDDLADVETGDFLLHPAVAQEGLFASSLERRERPLEAEGLGCRSVGPYRLLREIGAGGMASVWLAERNDGTLKRRVALKLPHRGLSLRTLNERMSHERDILGTLAHVHIARLYDAGVDADGQAYLALEYVEGMAITRFCDEQCLPVRARIGLLQQVLAAVQHAHQALVVHRDLKPSNILVTVHGEVRLLDFGIAKLLTDGTAGDIELTQIGGRAMTPDYASPEQIAGRAVGTASDVYSLGVLLYELLCGVRPYMLRRDSQGALEDAILDDEPARPSQRLITAEAGQARGTTPARLARLLRDDLDTIVLKALKKDPADRYPTAEAFRQDLQRWLDGLPVQARPDSVAYRGAKFVRRNALGVAAGLAVVGAVAGGVTATAWQAREAQAQAQRAQAVSDFVIGLFRQNDPVAARGRELSARDILDRGQADLQARLKDQPRAASELQGVLVDLYGKLGDERRAVPLAESRRDTLRRLDGPQSLSYGRSLVSLAELYTSTYQLRQAVETYTQARAILQRHPPASADDLLAIDGHLAFLLARTQRQQEALQLHVTLLPRLQARYGPESWEVVRSQAHLASLVADLGDVPRALAIHQQIAPWLDALEAAHPLEVIEVRYGRGYVQLKARDHEAAIASFRRFIADADRLLGKHNARAPVAQQALVTLLTITGRYAEAAQMADQNVERAQQAAGDDAVATRIALSSGFLWAWLGRADEGERLARLALAQLDKVAGMTVQRERRFQRHLAAALLLGGKAGEAQALLVPIAASEAAPGFEAASGAKGKPNSLDEREAALTLNLLSGTRLALRDPAAAERDAARAEQRLAGVRDSETDLAHTLLLRAQAILEVAAPSAAEQAEATLLRAEALVRDHTPVDHPDRQFVRIVKARLLHAQGHAAEAEREEAVAQAALAALHIRTPRPLAFPS